MRVVTARRKLQTAAPAGVKATSGSSVRLPTMVTWVSGMLSPPRGSGLVLAGRARWWSGWVAWSSFLGLGQQVPAGVGSLGGPPRSAPLACWSGAAPRPPRATGFLRAAWTTAGSRGAGGHPAGTRGTERSEYRSALEADGGQVAARLAGNRPVRVRGSGSPGAAPQARPVRAPRMPRAPTRPRAERPPRRPRLPTWPVATGTAASLM